MTRFRLLVSDPLGAAGLEILEQAPDIDLVDATSMLRSELLEVMHSADALVIRSGTTVDTELLEAGTRLKVIGRAGVGVDNIDLDAATTRGVVVVNTPQANTIATAEQAMALMLSATRRTASAHASMLEGRWDRKSFTGVDLNGRTLGIIGFGRIGREVAARARAFGMKIVAYDPFVSELVGREYSVDLLDLDHLLESADVITLHAVPAADGSALLGPDEFARLKRGAVIVNAARGQLIDEASLATALDDGTVLAAALDVYQPEPPQHDNPLIGHPRVVHTPHLGASTVEAQRDVSLQVVEYVLGALRGDSLNSCVNVPFDFDAETEARLKLATAMGRIQQVMAPSALTHVEVEVSNGSTDALSTVAAGVLAGVLSNVGAAHANFVNAPALAAEHGITIAQGWGIGLRDYPNLISCQVSWEGGTRIVSGVIFGGAEPRIVQVSGYQLDARPDGIVLMMLNDDVPGVIGAVGTLLGDNDVNIGEWRLGRGDEKGTALSFINLDAMPQASALTKLRNVPGVLKAEVVDLG
ncbi:MAG: phosphoglycerate dehydrogenase [Actinomycetia bacterium]|nr:phosphoglycerate dehydrogenase [Actinomycetes bacterium]